LAKKTNLLVLLKSILKSLFKKPITIPSIPISEKISTSYSIPKTSSLLKQKSPDLVLIIECKEISVLNFAYLTNPADGVIPPTANDPHNSSLSTPTLSAL
jgi:hypothetical protein